MCDNPSRCVVFLTNLIHARRSSQPTETPRVKQGERPSMNDHCRPLETRRARVGVRDCDDGGPDLESPRSLDRPFRGPRCAPHSQARCGACGARDGPSDLALSVQPRPDRTRDRNGTATATAPPPRQHCNRHRDGDRNSTTTATATAPATPTATSSVVQAYDMWMKKQENAKKFEPAETEPGLKIHTKPDT
jgi:hypothetical protein